MYYNISINQKAIVDFNKQNTIKVDLVDGVIIEYLQKQTTSSFAKRNHLIKDNEVYFLLSYENIITQLPLLNIENKEVIARRIKKLKDLQIINHFVDRKQGCKIFFNTTDIFESFFSYDLPTQKSSAPDSKVDTLPTQKSSAIYIDNNINDNYISDNRKIYKKENENDFQEVYKTFCEKEELQERTIKSKEYQDTFKKYQNALKKYSHEEILKGIQDYIIYLQCQRKTGFNRDKQGIIPFFNQEKFLGEKGLSWQELIDKISKDIQNEVMNKLQFARLKEDLKSQIKQKESESHISTLINNLDF